MAAACLVFFGVFRRDGSEQLGPSTVVVRASRELLVSQLTPESLSRHRPCMMGLACFSTAAWVAGQRLALGARKLVYGEGVTVGYRSQVECKAEPPPAHRRGSDGGLP